MFETLAVGTMNFGRRTPEKEARSIIDLAIERGATFFDTANMYCDGDSEKILGRALGNRRNAVKIATKVGVWRKEGLSKQRVLASLDESLERLKTEYVDVYYFHSPDPATPFAESLEAIAALFSAGKIRAWGLSNFAAWQVGEVNALCDASKLPRPAYSQVLYNLLIRQIEIEYLPFVKKHPIHTTVYNPLAGGLLARPVTAAIPSGSRFEANPIYRKRYWSDRMHELTRAMQDVANTAGVSLITLAYAWLLERSGVNSVLTGPASLAHFEAALEGISAKLPATAIAAADDAYRQFIGTEASYAR